MDIILASASLRRVELLKKITSNFKVIVSDFEESDVLFSANCGDYVMALAKGKAVAVCSSVKKPAVIIGCDTIVYFKGKVLGKPKNNKRAFQMISDLSDNTHEVYTGIAVINTETQEISTEYVCTEVKFSKLSSIEINNYIEKGESLDKAGAYGIQGAASLFVEEIKGCYYSVVGLPVNKLYFMLREMGVNL
ncbi:Maf-like protein [Clostridium sp. CM027]|uniref:Maf-like protein n=1 Tax=Clostridium sp. CM027 TaxID=2849865 RepID=UPI001C6E2916|nr:Maf-like protein [Clostridium sp. CM027]MBW9144342.1 Maf-like protein [Clostridium sp. CM027]UVE41026.1 Maf-like protein [Clostridium sp. CM027]